MPTTASSGRLATRRPSSASTCLTYGQWLHRNATSRAGAAAKSSRRTVWPVRSGRAKSGAGMPRGTIVEETAMPSTLRRARPCLREPSAHSAFEDPGADQALLGQVPPVGGENGGERGQLGPDLDRVARGGERPDLLDELLGVGAQVHGLAVGQVAYIGVLAA